LEWLVRLATVVLVRQLFIMVHVGWEGGFILCWVCLLHSHTEGRPTTDSAEWFEWGKGSDVDVWLHLFSLHAAAVMFIRKYEPAQQMLLSWRER